MSIKFCPDCASFISDLMEKSQEGIKSRDKYYSSDIWKRLLLEIMKERFPHKSENRARDARSIPKYRCSFELIYF
jgi:hypothetical protein